MRYFRCTLGMNWLRSGIFLLLVNALTESASENEDLNVKLEPHGNITVCEGTSVTINCRLNNTENYKVSWYYNETNGKNIKWKQINERDTTFTIENNGQQLTSPSIRTSESGWYFCKVTKDIPFLKQVWSNELHVVVEANSVRTSTQGPNQTQNQDLNQTQSITNSPTTCSPSAFTSETASPTVSPVPIFDQWWIWVALAGGCVILIVSVVVTICCYMLACKNTSKEIIYENTPSKKMADWRRTRVDSCNLPASKKLETIKPLKKYDTLSQGRIHRP